MALWTGSYDPFGDGESYAKSELYPPGYSGSGPLVATISSSANSPLARHHIASYKYSIDKTADLVDLEDNSPPNIGFLQKTLTKPLSRYYTASYQYFEDNLTINEVFGIDVRGTLGDEFSVGLDGRSGPYYGSSRLVGYLVRADDQAPTISNRNPASGATDVLVDSLIQFQIDDVGNGYNAGGVYLETIHVRLAIIDNAFQDVIISGTFQIPFNDISSSITPGGSIESGSYTGFDIVIDNTLNFSHSTEYIISVTASDYYGNTVTDEWSFLTEQDALSCYDFLEPAFNTGDYTISDGARRLIEHYSPVGCRVQQAPRQFAIPGAISLRNFGVTAYAPVSFNRTYNQTNGTEFSLGTSSS